MKSLADMDQTALKFEIVKLREVLKISGDTIAKFKLFTDADEKSQNLALEQIIRALK